MSRSCKDYGLACVTSTKLPFQATLSVHPSVCKYLQLYISMSDITVQLSPQRLPLLGALDRIDCKTKICALISLWWRCTCMHNNPSNIEEFCIGGVEMFVSISSRLIGTFMYLIQKKYIILFSQKIVYKFINIIMSDSFLNDNWNEGVQSCHFVHWFNELDIFFLLNPITISRVRCIHKILILQSQLCFSVG